jgi:hypothetical protein
MTADLVYGFAPHNYVVMEFPEDTALVAWGTMKGDEQVTLEAANQQKFVVLPPEAVRNDVRNPLAASYLIVRTEMRYVPNCTGEQLDELLLHELMLEPDRTMSIAEDLPVDELLNNYDRIEDIADLDPKVHPFLQDEIANNAWPLERIMINYSGCAAIQTDPHPGHYVPVVHAEGKIVATRTWVASTADRDFPASSPGIRWSSPRT